MFLLASNLVSAQVTRGVAPSWTGGDPGLRTVGASTITGGVAFKAFYNSLDSNYNNTDTPILYVEYGTTGTLGTATEGRYQATGNRIEEFTVPGLDNKKTYYFRAVLMYNNKTAYGEVLEYKPGTGQTVTTSTQTTSQTSDTTQNENEVVSDPSVPSDIWPWSLFSWFGGGNKNTATTKPNTKNEHGARISITNNVTETGLGQNSVYTISYANTSGKTLNNVDIEVLLPLEYSFVDTDKGDYYSDAHSVLLKLYTFEPQEKGTINITVQGTGKKAQKYAEASAHLYTDKNEVVVYDIDTYTNKKGSTTRSARIAGTRASSQQSATASANPLSGSTMIGWLIIGLIIAGVVFVSYKYFKKDKY